MKRGLIAVGSLLLLYLATGFYVVRGNEKVAVRRCGSLLRNSSGRPSLRGSGLHYDLPFPFTQIDRVNLHEVRTVTVGMSELTEIPNDKFPQKASPVDAYRYLTGDKNILNIQFGIQYRISEEQIEDYLFGNSVPEKRLRALAASLLSDVVAQSGVDFMHTHGRAKIQELLTERLRSQSETYRLGIRVETVTLEKIEPPLRVRAAFLDVNNARADKRKYINAARAYAAERAETARADAQQIDNAAETAELQIVERAKAEAESFVKLVSQFQSTDSRDAPKLAAARTIAMQRLYIETMESIFRRVKGKVILESGKPVDLTILRNPLK